MTTNPAVFHCNRFHNRPGYEADNLLGKEWVKWAFRYNAFDFDKTKKYQGGSSYLLWGSVDVMTYSIGVVVASVVRTIKWTLIGLFSLVKAFVFGIQKGLNTFTLGYFDEMLCDPWIQRMPKAMVHLIVALEKVVHYCLGTPVQINLSTDTTREQVLEGARKIMSQLGTLPLP